MSEAGGSGAGAALGGAIANVASVQSPPSKQSAKVHGANRKADKLDAEQNTLCKTCGCPAGTLKANILKCDGGTGVWNKAKAAIGKEPTIEVGPVDKGFHGQMTPEGAKIEQNPKEHNLQFSN